MDCLSSVDKLFWFAIGSAAGIIGAYVWLGIFVYILGPTKPSVIPRKDVSA